MAISGFAGLTGSGKSYNVISQVILPTLKEGRHIVTNIPLTDNTINEFGSDSFTQFEINKDFKPADFFKEDNIKKGSIYIIDECQKIWQQGKKVNNFSEGEIAFFTEHRHMVGENGYTTEIVVITQDFSQVSTFLRNLINQTWVCTKLTKTGLDTKYRVDVYDGTVTGQKPPKSRIVSSYYGTYKKDVFKYYKTQTKNDTSFSNGLEKAGSNKTIFSSVIFKLGLPFALIIFLFVGYSSYSFYSKFQGNKNNTKSSINDTSTSSINKKELKNNGIDNINNKMKEEEDEKEDTFLKYGLSKLYRIAGEIYFKGTSYRVIYITDNERTYPFPFAGSCKDMPYLGVVCDFFGEKVSYFSGIIEKEDNFTDFGNFTDNIPSLNNELMD